MDKIYVKNPDFVQREIAGEFLLIPIRRQLSDVNSLYVLNETGAHIWKQIDGARTVGQIQSEVLSAFEASEEQIAKDVESLFRDLAAIQAICEKT